MKKGMTPQQFEELRGKALFIHLGLMGLWFVSLIATEFVDALDDYFAIILPLLFVPVAGTFIFSWWANNNIEIVRPPQGKIVLSY